MWVYELVVGWRTLIHTMSMVVLVRDGLCIMMHECAWRMMDDELRFGASECPNKMR